MNAGRDENAGDEPDEATGPTRAETDLRLREAEGLFLRALDVPKRRRGTWLERAASDPDLRSLVVELLQHHRDDDALTGLDAIDAPVGGFRRGEEIGPYRIVGELGRGGMGIVYEAERADHGQRVALKLARERFPSRARVLRFEREERVLARLQHPNIAQIHDAGITDEGVPYFAMETVEGEDIVAHARTSGLHTRGRLELFLAACSAVQYAHRNLIVHRDLKPSNVLVTGAGRVKLLDFGVAKLLEEPDMPGLTRTEARIYTPGYAAPEQLRGEAVTTATDVYQLGVLLYELLADEPAFDVSGLTPFEAERRVLETDPPAPSRRAAGPDAARSGDAETRTVPRDLDSIALKAIAKAPERRYASADALAADVRR